MPRVECGFIDDDNNTAQGHLLGFGPSLLVDIGYIPKEGEIEADVILQRPEARAEGIPALIDTGASTSCIDRALAEELELPIVDRRPFGGIAGEYEANMYLAHIYAPVVDYIEYGLFAG